MKFSMTPLDVVVKTTSNAVMKTIVTVTALTFQWRFCNGASRLGFIVLEQLHDAPQWTHIVTITLLLLYNNVATPLWRNNDVFITPCVRWGSVILWRHCSSVEGRGVSMTSAVRLVVTSWWFQQWTPGRQALLYCTHFLSHSCGVCFIHWYCSYGLAMHGLQLRGNMT